MKNNCSMTELYILHYFKNKKEKGKIRNKFNHYSLWVVETLQAVNIMMLASQRDDKPVEPTSLQTDPQFKTFLL